MSSIVLAAEADRLTLALAVVGCVTGVIGTLLALLTFRRDRPRLTISSVTEVDEEPTVHRIRVYNGGRQPVALVEVGFTWPSYHDHLSLRGRLGWHFARFREHRLGWVLGPSGGPDGEKFADSDYVLRTPLRTNPRVIGPGEATVFKASFDEVAGRVAEEGRTGQPVWAYVEDARGRRTRATHYALYPSWGQHLPDPFEVP